MSAERWRVTGNGISRGRWGRSGRAGRADQLSLVEVSLIRRRLKGETFEEIAQALGLPSSGAARSALQYLRHRLGTGSTAELLKDPRVLEAIKESDGGE